MMGLLLVPNTLLAWLLLGQRISSRFAVGSVIAIAGIVLLLVNEARSAPLGGNVWLGVALALGGMLSASVANVVQASDTGRDVPMASLLAWSMAYGVMIDGALAWAMTGPPVVPRDFSFWAGTTYLAIAGSVVTFPLYFKLVRDLGAGKAAYNGVVTLILAMAISTMFEGYRWTLLAVMGSLLALAGLIVALRSRSPS
jgi:drug/metabolite transporter (DMT)-like permease